MLTVGQKLWYVPSSNWRGNPHEVTVEKVGRKWADIGPRRRIDIKTLLVDGGQYSSPGTCYLSREAYEDVLKLNRSWDNFKKLVACHYVDPSGMTIERIEQAMKILGFDEKEGK